MGNIIGSWVSMRTDFYQMGQFCSHFLRFFSFPSNYPSVEIFWIDQINSCWVLTLYDNNCSNNNNDNNTNNNRNCSIDNNNNNNNCSNDNNNRSNNNNNCSNTNICSIKLLEKGQQQRTNHSLVSAQWPTERTGLQGASQTHGFESSLSEIFHLRAETSKTFCKKWARTSFFSFLDLSKHRKKCSNQVFWFWINLAFHNAATTIHNNNYLQKFKAVNAWTARNKALVCCKNNLLRWSRGARMGWVSKTSHKG